VRFVYYALSSLRIRGVVPPAWHRRRVLALLLAGAAVAATACASGPPAGGMGAGNDTSQQRAAAANPDLDPGTSLSGTPAPDFTLTNQFGQQISLSAFRGKVVILAFTDSECTTICPLTTQSMLAAKDLLGKAGEQVQLISVDANPAATSVADVMSYSRTHGMVNQWDFLTGTLSQLKSVWKDYKIYVQIVQGQIDHTPAVFVIDSRGREQKIYLTTMAYASIGQAGQVLAQEASSLLPGHPALARTQSLAQITGLDPGTAATLPALPAGSIALSPGTPHLLVFFATWLAETSDLQSELTGLNQYVQDARASGLPGLVAVDEEASEPSLATVRGYLAGLHGALNFPV
jgi:cytochrome oxidase Cu insertion factor (SCO1/SenC/PrrC family)